MRLPAECKLDSVSLILIIKLIYCDSIEFAVPYMFLYNYHVVISDLFQTAAS